MNPRIYYTLMYGTINKDLRVDFCVTYDKDPESKFRTVKENDEKQTVYIRPSHSVTISEGFDKPRLFIPGAHLPYVTDIISKTLKAVSEHLMELYPKIGNPEFDVDIVALETFTKEHVVSVNGYNAVPCIYVTRENECKPAIRVNNPKGESIKLPLTDAIIISRKFETLDPDTFGLTLFNMIR